ncbi:MAG TPA: hypothetical protein VK963_03535 [Candidatus Saccharimonadales bacterium]|nr:hypothetical protein [Candidatus Saccharimonadales bacterium]
MHIPELLAVVLVRTAEHLEKHGLDAGSSRGVEAATVVVQNMARDRSRGQSGTGGLALLKALAVYLKRCQVELELEDRLQIDIEVVLRAEKPPKQ